SAKVLFAKIKEANIKIQVCKRNVLDTESEGGRHQGFIAFATEFVYSELSDILEFAKSKNQPPLLVALDCLEDPHNLGSIIRTCECLGAHGIIITKNRSVTVNDTVMRVAQGASEYVKIAKVTNLNQTLDNLKKEGLWIIGADMDGEDIRSADLSGAVCLVIGGEGQGVSQLTKKTCDKLISIKMNGQINSLNASVATGIVLYEAVKGRF
ncbi:MAG: 23S rRNA (guanosine(2251)-2'-O)-methyltransferase RlmB, partial [Clostridia bacterium]